MLVSATWEILSADHYAKKLKKKWTHVDRLKVYQGNYISLVREKQIIPTQMWTLSIETIARSEDGFLYNHELDWSFSAPMTLSEIINGSKNVKLNKGGISVRWEGIAKAWAKEIATDFQGLTVTQAWATAQCDAEVKKLNPANVLLGKIFKMGNMR